MIEAAVNFMNTLQKEGAIIMKEYYVLKDFYDSFSHREGK